MGEVWAYFRRCRSVEQFVGGIWGNSWNGLSGGPKRKTCNTRIPRLLRYAGHEAVSAVQFGMWNSFNGELCEDIMGTPVCPHAILISNGHRFGDLTRWQCSGIFGSVVACQL